MARIREIAQGLDIILGQRHEGFLTPGPAPAVALNAADQPLAVVVDLDQRAMAVGAVLHPMTEPFSITTAVSSTSTLLGETKKAPAPVFPVTSLFDVAECN